MGEPPSPQEGPQARVLEFLSENKHITGYVKTIDLIVKDMSDDPAEISELKNLFPEFKNLRRLRLRGFCSAFMDMLLEVRPTCGISFENYGPSFRPSRTGGRWAEPLEQVPNVVSISVVAKEMEPLQQLFQAQPGLRRFAVLTRIPDQAGSFPDLPHSTYTSFEDPSYDLPPIEYLDLTNFLGPKSDRDETIHRRYEAERITFLNNLQWHALRALDLEGGVLIQRLFTHYGDRLASLRHLSLWNNDDAGDGPYVEHPAGLQATVDFLNTPSCGQNLRTLILRGYSLKFPMTCIKLPKLQSLRFHTYEENTRATSIIRPASDIRHLAQHCPQLCNLAIDFPEMSNLFHPTAIPGVDTDVGIYTFLQAISEIPKLSHLQLFPPYTRLSEDQPQPTYAQPFADDDLAIRLFKHIKAYQALHRQSTSSSSCPPTSSHPTLPVAPSGHTTDPAPLPLTQSTLTHLMISSDNIFVKFISSFEAQSWSVTEANGRFFMTLRQAGKSYEQRQVWEGERRLRTEIRRDRYPRSYEAGFADGMDGRDWGDV